MEFLTKTTISPVFDETVLGTNDVRNKTINYIKTDWCIGYHIKIGKYWEEWMIKYIQENYIENTRSCKTCCTCMCMYMSK